MAEIPRDILIEILLRFPAKLLVRFRCVSKSLCTLIDSQLFNNLFAARNNSTTLLLVRSSAFSLSLDSSENCHMKLQSSFKVDGMGRFGYHSYPQGSCEGSCDGLVCMSNGDGVVAIWNPTTRNCTKSPDTSKVGPVQIRHTAFGFGYDSTHDEYKVVRIVQGCYAPFDTAATVFNVKTGIWRSVCDFPYRVVTYKRQPPRGVLACGASHWVVTRKYYDKENIEHFIAAFDFATEEYRLLPLPRFDNISRVTMTMTMRIGVLEDCVCLMCRHRCGVDVYMMKEYGVKESWHKICCLPVRRYHMYEFFRPLAYSLNRKEILFAGEEILFWFDLENNKMKEIKVPCDWYYAEKGVEVCGERKVRDDWYYAERDVEVCGESVAPISGGKRIE